MTLNLHREGSGEPLLLIHGIGSDLHVWEPVLSELGSHFDVIAVDLPGFGESPPLPAGVTPTPAALASAVAELLDELGLDRAHLAGNSLGGWVALELGVAGRARSVSGICPAGLWGTPTLHGESTYRGRAHRLARRLGPLLPILMLSRRLRRLALGPFVGNPDAVPYPAAWRMIRSYGRSTAYDATATAMRRGQFSRRAAARIDVPVTLAFGERDRLVRPTRILTPGARTLILPRCGHIPTWDDPRLIAAVIEQTAQAAERPPAGLTRQAP